MNWDISKAIATENHWQARAVNDRFSHGLDRTIKIHHVQLLKNLWQLDEREQELYRDRHYLFDKKISERIKHGNS